MYFLAMPSHVLSCTIASAETSELCGMRFLMLFQANNFLGYLQGGKGSRCGGNLRVGIIQFDATPYLKKNSPCLQRKHTHTQIYLRNG